MIGPQRDPMDTIGDILWHAKVSSQVLRAVTGHLSPKSREPMATYAEANHEYLRELEAIAADAEALDKQARSIYERLARLSP